MIIYLLYYSENKKINLSFGKLLKKEKNDLIIFPYSSNDFPFGAPIFNFKNKKLLGFYNQFNKYNNYHEGIFILNPLHLFISVTGIPEFIIAKAIRRIMREVIEFKLKNQNLNNNIILYPIKEYEYDIFGACITIKEDSPYKGGKFYVHIQVTYKYPFEPPIVFFKSKIYHPNLRENGLVCLHNLRILKDWSPLFSISKVLLDIKSLIINPNPEICDKGNREAWLMMKNDRKKFEEKAKEWTKKYSVINNSESIYYDHYNYFEEQLKLEVIERKKAEEKMKKYREQNMILLERKLALLKEKEEEEKRKREEEEKKKIEEEEKRKREEEEEEILIKKKKEGEEKLKIFLDKTQEPDYNNPDICHIKFRLPCGQRILEKKFLKTEKISNLFNYMNLIKDILFYEFDSENFDIICLGFPPISLTNLKNSTLEKEGLYPNSFLQVKNI